jgi:hypothetical protein
VTKSSLRTDLTASIGGNAPEPEWLGALRQQVTSLRFGVVQVMVHEGRVVQIERTEKIRFEPKPASAA